MSKQDEIQGIVDDLGTKGSADFEGDDRSFLAEWDDQNGVRSIKVFGVGWFQNKTSLRRWLNSEFRKVLRL